MLNNDEETTSVKRPVAIYNVNRSRSVLYGESDIFDNLTDMPNVSCNTCTIYTGKGQFYLISRVDIGET